ncbi:MAG TPA: hypothetical protein VFU96_11855, partial [Acidimicrobiia bacterium]|nr:hypothetical protein [Acidimicrobiia bacterium]
MINEIALAAALTISGSFLLTAVRRDVTAVARCWLSMPIGAAAYLLVALVSLVFFDTLDPVITLLVVLGLGLVVVAVSLSKGGLGRDDLLWMMIG